SSAVVVKIDEQVVEDQRQWSAILKMHFQPRQTQGEIQLRTRAAAELSDFHFLLSPHTAQSAPACADAQPLISPQGQGLKQITRTAQNRTSKAFRVRFHLPTEQHFRRLVDQVEAQVRTSLCRFTRCPLTSIHDFFRTIDTEP